MLLLLVSIAALFAGVLAFPLAAKKNTFLSLLDGFVVFSVGGLVIFHLLPHCLNEAGFGAIGAVTVGLTFPLLIERWSAKRNTGKGSPLLVVLALSGLAIHAFLDGNALVFASIEESGAGPDNGNAYEHGFTLALASLFHRLPIGLVIGNLLAKGRSLRRPLAVAGIMAATTCVGFFVGDKVLPVTSHYTVVLFQAFVSGTLLHVVLEHVPVFSSGINPAVRVLRGVGALAGAGSVAIVAMFHPITRHCDKEIPAADIFVSLVLEVAPALLAALICAGIIRLYIYPALTRFQMKGPVGQTLRFDTVLVSLPLLGPAVTFIRFIASAIAAFTALLILENRIYRPFSSEEFSSKIISPGKSDKSTFLKMRSVLGYGFGEFADHLLPWMLVGLGAAALAEPLIHETALAEMPGWVQVPIVALFGMPIYVCGSGMTPLMAVLIHKGLTVGAAIAFLLVGPMIGVTTFSVFFSRYGRLRTICFAVAMWVFACIVGWSVNAIGIEIEIAPYLSDQSYAVFPFWLCLFVLMLLSLVSFLRCGPRGWLGQLNAAYDDHGQCDLPGHHHHEADHDH
ncbi:MAG: hypothetical protein GY762_23955 [Proteobacteria bacterium]|nr:hypothetical protein [Pseudomonadota bacterium]